MKKILFLTLYPPSVPSSRFRVGQYVEHFRADGIDVEMAPAIPEALYRGLSRSSNVWRAMGYYFSELFCRTATLLKPSDHNVVVLQKGILSIWLCGMESFLKKFHGRLVFDMDDAVHLNPPNALPRALRFLQAKGQTQRILGNCSAVLAANEELAIAAGHYNARVHVIPTAVDTDHFTPRLPDVGQSCDGKHIRLLWTGNRSGNAYVNDMAPVIRRLREVGVAARLTVLSDGPDFLKWDDFPGDTLRYVPWSVASERVQLQQADAGVMPLVENPWNRAKSGYKTMIYMASGLPSVSSPVGSITRIVRDGENGFIARGEDQWVHALRCLAYDKRLRQQMGASARRTIEETYSVKKIYPRLKHALLGAA